MGRPIILKPVTSTGPVELRSVTPTSKSRTLSQAELSQRLRMKRSTRYIEALTRLDAGCHCQDPRVIEALIAAIQEELPEVTIEKLPIGVVSKCHLGADYEVHTLDRTGGIVQHYRSHQSLPPLLERARSLALHSQYVFVEIYVDSMVAVRLNGEVSVVNL